MLLLILFLSNWASSQSNNSPFALEQFCARYDSGSASTAQCPVSKLDQLGVSHVYAEYNDFLVHGLSPKVIKTNLNNLNKVLDLDLPLKEVELLKITLKKNETINSNVDFSAYQQLSNIKYILFVFEDDIPSNWYRFISNKPTQATILYSYQPTY